MNPSQLLPLIAFAAAMGIRHAFEADHIAAITMITGGDRGWKKAAAVGVFWGAGHTVALLIATAILVTTKMVVPVEVTSYLEAAVGIMIVILALRLLRDVVRGKFHDHRHEHGTVVHVHPHAHERQHDASHHHSVAVMARPFTVGLVHGAAGSATLLVTTLASTAGTAEALLSVLVFGVGSTAGMAFASSLVTLPLRFSAQRGNVAFQLLTAVIAISSVVFGLHYCYSALSGV
jgi:high-affinity nickel permease